jgi:macrolide transport system ATP-binding/permease protein
LADLALDDGAPSAFGAQVGAFVRVYGVSRRYPNGTVALEGVDLTIAPGETVAVVGRSGSGKSTLLNVLGLLDVPDEGELVIDGHAVGASDSQRSARRSSELGFIFQRSHLIPSLTVRDNVMLGLRYSNVAESEIREATEDALRAVGLHDKINARARTLSGGEMQRVAIARTLSRPARLWLADEPTGNLDSAQSIEIIELLKLRAKERHACLVVVTHEPEIAARMDRVVTLSDGRIINDTGSVVGVRLTDIRDPEPDATRPFGRASARRLARTIRFVAQGVIANPGRTRSGVMASALAVALTVAALGLAQSAATQVTGLFDAQRATQVTAELANDSTSQPRWPIGVDVLQIFPGVTGVEMWRHWSGVPMTNGSVASQDVELIQVDAAPSGATDSAVTWAVGDDGVLEEGEVVLGAVLAKRLGVTQIDVSPEVTLRGARLRVVGILTASRSGTATGSAFVTTAAPADLGPWPSAQIFVETAPGAARNVADRMQALVDPFQSTRISIDPVLEADNYRGELQQSVAAALLVLAVVASLAGLGAVVFVNILSVNSRTAEFGVRRAFGARRGEIVSLVVGECTALGLIGAVLGLAAGFVAVMTVTAVARWQPVFDERLLVVPILGALIFGTLGSLPPAIAAGRVEPADAVRT